MKKYFVLLCVLLFAGSVPCAEVLLDKENGFEFFTGGSVKVIDGILTQQVVVPDTQVYFYDLAIDPAKETVIEIIYRASGLPERTTGEIFFMPAGGKPDAKRCFRLPSLKSDGLWHAIRVSASDRKYLADPESWRGMKAKRYDIRLDMIDQVAPGGVIEVRSIRFCAPEHP
ncbi:MAG: hypothetical protein PHS41_04260 [Victivallaceae bacterium]|nr:hypothetical protein [Victivallaceae bacterium]